MENEDKRPVVWVARRLNRRMSGCMGSTIAYFTSKARVQSVTRRFLKNGKEVKEYEVEYETPQALEEISYDSDIYAEAGYYVKYNMVFRNYEKCRAYVDNLNDELALQHIKSAEKSGFQTKQRVKEECLNNKIFARKLEKYFDRIGISDVREF